MSEKSVDGAGGDHVAEPLLDPVHAAHPPTSPARPPARPAAVARGTVAPIGSLERLTSLDTLRGVAVLGILPMNVLTGFALASASYYNPASVGGFTGANYAVWLLTHLLLEVKMMTIFSMLFGAGLVVIAERSERTGRSAAGLYYTRLGWLALIGVVHAYALWFGDILFTYAVCGVLLYPLRRLRPAWLIGIGLVVMMVVVPVFVLLGVLFDFMRGDEPEQWAQMEAGFGFSDEAIAEEVDQRTGSIGSLLVWNAGQSIMMQTVLLAMFSFWRSLGVMLIGMGLMKLGVFSALRSKLFYTVMMLTGYVVGLPLVLMGVQHGIEHKFDIIESFRVGLHFNYVGSLAVAIGHTGLVMLLCKLDVLGFFGRALRAVGRMALTNYLSQTVICMFLFSAMGLGLLNQLDRVELMNVVAVIWAAQLSWSPLWLARFRFGPAEWVWRSLTYWKPQPMIGG